MELHPLKFEEGIEDIFKCSKCLKIPGFSQTLGRHIYQCNRGHIVCYQCNRKIRNCPTCNFTLRYNVRSLLAENLLDRVHFPCKFKTNGCDFKFIRQILGEHEEECFYRLVKCPAPECKENVPLSKLADHVEKESSHSFRSNNVGGKYVPYGASSSHRIMVDTLMFYEEYYFDNFDCIKIFFDQKYFFCRQSRNSKGQWFIWVYLLEDNCSTYDYKITISLKKNDAGFERKLATTCRPISLDLVGKDVENSGNCLTFSDDIAQQFTTMDFSDVKDYEMTPEEEEEFGPLCQAPEEDIHFEINIEKIGDDHEQKEKEN